MAILFVAACSVLSQETSQFRYVVFYPVNPLGPNVHLQILQTDLHTAPLTIS